MLIAIVEKVISAFFEYDLIAEKKANTTFLCPANSTEEDQLIPFH
ncbi:hypothetical protein J2W25_005168 [Variovorax boronicumulans]|uniref:Uncharacterized protein n=1 Tax=Variovorax boronicumulans TaxID=436515 RepID=A0AAW8E314_9BURK|nr:hypothetical protein [Variovorax boronicumulans]MDP9926121.1 hypothetical protein [Variovorax boronicumulans]